MGQSSTVEPSDAELSALGLDVIVQARAAARVPAEVVVDFQSSVAGGVASVELSVAVGGPSVSQIAGRATAGAGVPAGPVAEVADGEASGPAIVAGDEAANTPLPLEAKPAAGANDYELRLVDIDADGLIEAVALEYPAEDPTDGRTPAASTLVDLGDDVDLELFGRGAARLDVDGDGDLDIILAGEDRDHLLLATGQGDYVLWIDEQPSASPVAAPLSAVGDVSP